MHSTDRKETTMKEHSYSDGIDKQRIWGILILLIVIAIYAYIQWGG